MHLYKIQRKTDRLFSNGGYPPTFSRVGKIWLSKEYVKRHLALFTKRDTRRPDVTLRNQYEDCEVICYILNELGPPQDVLEFDRKFIYWRDDKKRVNDAIEQV